MRDIYKSVGRQIHHERKRAGLTIEELAGRASISSSFLSYVETGAKKCSLESVRKLAEALQIPPAALFREEADIDALNKDASARFKQLIHGCDKKAVEAVLDVVRVTAGALRKSGS